MYFFIVQSPCESVYSIITACVNHYSPMKLRPTVLIFYFPSLSCVYYLFYYGLFVQVSFLSLTLSIFFLLLFAFYLSIYISVCLLFLKRIIVHCFDSQQLAEAPPFLILAHFPPVRCVAPNSSRRLHHSAGWNVWFWFHSFHNLQCFVFSRLCWSFVIQEKCSFCYYYYYYIVIAFQIHLVLDAYVCKIYVCSN